MVRWSLLALCASFIVGCGDAAPDLPEADAAVADSSGDVAPTDVDAGHVDAAADVPDSQADSTEVADSAEIADTAARVTALPLVGTGDEA